MAAADTLVGSGLNVVVLEARDRVGGRLHTLPVAGVGLDVGATWFWPNESRVLALTAELGLATHTQHLAGDAIYHAPEGAERMDGNPIDVPAGRFVAGAQALADAVARGLPDGVTRLAHPVTHVRSTADGVEVRTPQGSFSARQLILAVPPALVVSAIEFTPDLPGALARLASVTPVWMGAITKVVARYAEPFWRYQGLAGAAISHVGPMREVHDMSGPDGTPAMLFGFVPPTGMGGATATPEEVLAQLVELFGPDAAHPDQLVIHDWRHEQYTSPPGVERLDANHVFGHPLFAAPTLGGRVHWASTETARASPGHIEGALAAAHRAAGDVIDAILGADAAGKEHQ